MSFVAQYHGVCASCEDPIVPGERIEGVDGEYTHLNCGQPAETVECVCELCWTVHVGVCI